MAAQDLLTSAALVKAQSLEARLDALITGADSGWQYASLQNSWFAYGSNHVIPVYRQVNAPPNSVWHIGIAAPGTISDGVVLYNVPLAYRPPTAQRIGAYTYGGSASASVNGPFIECVANGDVKLWGVVTGTFQVAWNGFISLDAPGP